MGEPMRNPFRVHHPISLTDALAAVFRTKPKKSPLGKISVGPGPALDYKDIPAMQAPALELVENSASPEPAVTVNSLH